MADTDSTNSYADLTRESFLAKHDTLTCHDCGQATLSLAYTANNGGYRVICACGSPTPLPGAKLYLPHSDKKKSKRKAYPEGQSLDEVWERFGNRCVCCSATKDQLLFLGIGRQRQHVAQYAAHGHDGPIVPMCVPCHSVATVRQREFQSWCDRLREVYGAPQPLPDRRPGLPAARVSSDPLPAARQAPLGGLEGVSDHHADR